MAGGAKLKDLHRAFLVKQLARFDTPHEAVEALRETFGIQITPQAAECYDPNKRASRHMAEKWKALFEETRRDFLENMDNQIPEANRAVRVKHLAKAAQAFKAKGNYVGMANMLENIAKEVGNVHTNRRELTGENGKPIQFQGLSDRQLDAALGQVASGLGLTPRFAGEEADEPGSHPVH